MRSVADNYRASIAYMNLNIAGLIVCIPAVNWFIYATLIAKNKAPVKDMIGASAIILLLVGIIYVFKRFRVKRLKELEAKIAVQVD
jgi:4-amino-4-deoxy-L-arabinose transferase-like glycosyltransferase